MRIGRRLSWRDAGAALSWRRVCGALVIALSLAALGYAGYVVGTPDVSLDPLRATATAEGREAGAKSGARAGYARGYQSARDRDYRAAYAAAYRRAYASEFERAGLDAPVRIQVPRPR
jgi:hypothetical protein